MQSLKTLPRGLGAPLPLARPACRSRTTLVPPPRRQGLIRAADAPQSTPGPDAPQRVQEQQYQQQEQQYQQQQAYDPQQESTAVYNTNTEPSRAYTQAPQQYYSQAPPSYPVQPMYYAPPPAATGFPWWLLVGGGILVGSLLGKLQELVAKGPQQMMAEMAMKKMMGSMGSSMGAAGQMPGFPGGVPPFGAPGGGASPFAGGAANPFAGGFPPQQQQQPPRNFSSGPTVDATAYSVSQQADGGRSGDKFNQRWSGNGSPGPDGVPVVEPTVSEPAGSSSRGGSAGGFNPTASSTSSRPAPSSFFTDVNVDAKAAGGAAPGPDAAGAPGASTSAEGGAMMEQILRSPSMQKMLYPYLPENMRNPQSIEWMLNSPEVKKQMETMFAQQNISPQMLAMMKNVDFDQDKVDQQFKQLGMKPEDVMSKVLANPELAAGFNNPKVQAAIMDISTNPMNVTKYASDPEIMKVLNEVQQLFKPDVAPEFR